jgi:hypothetical protein
MSQPPQGEEPQDRRPPGWGAPSGGGWGPPSGSPGPQGGGWGPPAGTPGPYGQQPPPGQYGGSPAPGGYGSPGQYGASPGYGPPGQYAPPGGYGQPGQYGAPPGYGQPGQYGGWEQPPPAPRKRRFGILFVLLVIALVIGLAVTLPARLSGTRLDPRAVQRDVAAQFQQREGVALDLRCDQQMTVQPGRTYQCTGTTADGARVGITIAITSKDGDYTWSDR